MELVDNIWNNGGTERFYPDPPLVDSIIFIYFFFITETITLNILFCLLQLQCKFASFEWDLYSDSYLLDLPTSNALKQGPFLHKLNRNKMKSEFYQRMIPQHVCLPQQVFYNLRLNLFVIRGTRAMNFQ